MAKGRTFEFKIPEPRGLNASPPYGKVVDHKLLNKQPTDANQFPPTPEYPVPQRYRMGGGC